MTTHTGKNGIVKVGANAIAEVKTFTVEETGDTAETTSMGDEWRTYLPTLKSWSGSVESQWDDADTTGQGALVTGAEVSLKLYPDDDATGDIEFSGSAIVTGISRSVSFDGIISISFTFQGSGALTKATVT